MRIVTLDTLEFRTPIADAEFNTRDGRVIKMPALVSAPWQRRINSLWDYVQRPFQPMQTIATRPITAADRLPMMMICLNTITLTLPADPNNGDTYYFFNYDVGVITILGNINGNPSGYQLVNPFQYVQLTNVDGTTNWIVTAAN